MGSRIEVNQSAGDLTLHTGRAGLGSKAGHDLTLRVGRWSGHAELSDTGEGSAIRVVAELSSLEVVRGDGGLKPLTDKDKVSILENATGTMKAKSHPELVFEAAGLELTEGKSRVTGQVSLAGVTKPQSLDLTITREGGTVSVEARGELLQTDFGIKPYTGLLGALKVRDMVEIRAQLTLATG